MKNPQVMVRGKAALDAELAKATTERLWLAHLIRMAHDEGWKVYHVFEQGAYARRTVCGWPDMECLRERLLFIEAKTERGQLSAEQIDMIARLKAAGQEVYILRPSQEDEARRILHRRVRA